MGDSCRRPQTAQCYPSVGRLLCWGHPRSPFPQATAKSAAGSIPGSSTWRDGPGQKSRPIRLVIKDRGARASDNWDNLALIAHLREPGKPGDYSKRGGSEGDPDVDAERWVGDKKGGCESRIMPSRLQTQGLALPTASH